MNATKKRIAVFKDLVTFCKTMDVQSFTIGDITVKFADSMQAIPEVNNAPEPDSKSSQVPDDILYHSSG